MNGRMVARILGLTALIFAALMLIPAAVGLYYGEDISAFLITIGITAALGGILLLFKPVSRAIYAKEGFVSVSLAWILMSLLGALPFVLSGDIPRYTDALFETVSGLTTTGASVVGNMEEMSRSGLFWRLFSHWIGGMGVLVFIMAVLPMGGEHSMHIMRAEIPGPSVGKLVPRARDTARLLYLIYGGLTLAEAVLLKLGGMSFYDAVLHAFASAGTGGFSTRAASIGAYNSAYIEMVIAAFLFLFGANFNLYYLILRGKPKEALKSEELHCYIAIVAAATISIAAGIYSIYGSAGLSLRNAFFNVTALISTAGFGTVDYTIWPQYTQVIIVMLMFIGGCAGSTGGGLKLSRVMLLVKAAGRDIGKMIHPRSVRRVRMDGKCVDKATLDAVEAFFFLYLFIIIICTLVISFDGYDFATNFTAALSCMSNIGPGLSLIGPSGSFAIFSDCSKIVMSFVMLLGRLEIYPLIILLTPSVWNRNTAA